MLLLVISLVAVAVLLLLLLPALRESYAPDIYTGPDQYSRKRLELIDRREQERAKYGAHMPFRAENVDTVSDMENITKKENQWLKSVFKSLMDPKSQENLFDRPAGFQRVSSNRYEAAEIIDYVLNLVNQSTGLRFKAIDIQSYKKEIKNLDDGSILDRYTIQLFVSDDLDGKVNDVAKDLAMVVTRHNGTTYSIRYLDLLGDNLYNLDLIPPNDPYDKYFKILGNPGLTEPWPTDRSKVLYPYETMDVLRRITNQGRRRELYACYGVDGTVKDADTRERCVAAQGIWDTPAQADSECPFYRANQNYNNRRGGIMREDGESTTVEGRCEMPLGVKRIGYKYYSDDPAHRPWCYNCKVGVDGQPGSYGPCCEEQEKAITAGYSPLVTPDYVFEGDTLERKHDQGTLAAKGLHWQEHPNRQDTKDVEPDFPQLSPVHNAFVGTSGY
jgi:hypothetical protein